MNSIFVTTSWDDGHVLDLKLADILRTYSLKGTFYIAPENREFSQDNLLTDEQILDLSKDFEIGAHTVTHPHLSKVDNATAQYEILESKLMLEKIINKKVTSFCYPAGMYTKRDVMLVKKSGYLTARTVERFHNSLAKPLELGTTIHTYDHWSDIPQIVKTVNFNLATFVKLFRRWDLLAMKMFDTVLTDGGVFHLWGHSWELENRQEWARLDRVCSYISNRQSVKYVTNSELYE